MLKLDGVLVGKYDDKTAKGTAFQVCQVLSNGGDRAKMFSIKDFNFEVKHKQGANVVLSVYMQAWGTEKGKSGINIYLDKDLTK